jgi:hypothetical protein
MTAFYFENALAYYNAGVVAVSLEVVGSAPELDPLKTLLRN